MTPDRLPRAADWLLRALAPGEWRDSIAGDLLEERARQRSRGESAGVLWVYLAVLRIAARLGVERLRRAASSRRRPTARSSADALLVDLRQAARALVRHRGFTATTALTLALGIGANAAVFTAAWHLLLKPLPWPESERLVQIWNTSFRTGNVNVLAPANYLDIEREATTLDAVAAYTFFNYPLNLTGAGAPVEARVRAVTGAYFRVFGTPPQLGRALTREDAETNERVIVISHGLWQRQFGGVPGVLGRRVRLDDRDYEIVGVMPASFDPAGALDGWVPYHFSPELAERRLGFFLGAVGRLKAGVMPEQARAEVVAIASRAASQFPESNRNIGATVRSMREELSAALRSTLALLVACAAFVLLIACANLTSLQLARAGGMARELAVRAAVGASRWQIVRLLLVESLLVALLAGAAGLALGVWTLQAVVASAPPAALLPAEWSIDREIVAAILVTAAMSGLLVGWFGARRAARAAALGGELRSRGPATAASARLRFTLVTTQVALATALLVSALTLVVSFARVLAVDLGFNPANVIAADLRLPPSRYSSAPRQALFFDKVLSRLASHPAVQGTCATNAVPLEQPVTMTYVPDGTEHLVSAMPLSVTRGCFATLGVTLRRGRLFADREPEPVAIVSDTYARNAWPGEDPVGKTIRVGVPDGERLTVIGVVGDSRRVSLETESFGQVYHFAPQSTYFWPSRVLVRATAPPDVIATALREAVSAADPTQPVGNLRRLEDVVSRSLGSRRFQLLLLGGFAAIATLLAAVGIYGLLAHLVAGRRSEIGVRMALGASRSSIVRLITRGATRAVLAGVAAGLTGAALASKVIAQFVFGVSPTHPAFYAAAALLLVAVSATASLVPLRRATAIDPGAVLRSD